MRYGQLDDESVITEYLDSHLEEGIKQKNLDKILDLIDEYVELKEKVKGEITMKAKTSEIKEQSAFCKELAIRLDKDIQKSNMEMTNGTGVSFSTRKQADITRLRIELMKLSKMMEWDFDKEK